MHYQDKTRKDLIKELQELQVEHNSLKTLYEKEITERKQVAETLKFTQMILDNAADTMTCIDYDGRYIDVNEAFCRSLGYLREELLSMTVHDIDPNYPAGIWSEFWEKLKQAGSLTFESCHRTKEGKLIPVEITVNFFEYNGKEYHCGFARDITERKLAEEALRQSEMKLKTLFEVLPIGVSILDAERNVAFINPALERILNMTKDGFIRGDYKSRKYLRPDGTQMPEEEFASVRAIREQREVHDVETGVLMEDGHVIWTNVNAAPVAFPDWKVVIITTDITGRKLVEETIRILARFPAENPHPILRVDRNGQLLYANEASYKFLTWKLQIGEKTPSVLQKIIAEALKEGIGKIIDTEHNQRVISFNIVPVVEADYANLYGRDITERKQAEEELRKSEDRFRNITDQVTDVIFMTNKRGHITYISPSARSVFGYSQDEMISMPFLKFLAKGEVPGAMTVFNLSMRSGQKRENLTFLMKHKDGSTFTGELIANAFYENDMVTGIIGVIRNVTERLQAEEEIRKSKKLLEDLHKHLNEILENERALISREIHDQIGQSLTALKLDLNWMHKYIYTNPESVAKLEGMIELVSNTIKDVQRISSDLRPGILDDLGLVSAIEWYCDEFEKRTGIKCNLELDNSDYSDSKISLTFFRVLQETLTNVIRHARASSVNIKLHQSDKGTTLTIQDNGIGIPKENIESHKSLGLINMRERVRQFNGKIDFSSKKGDGTKLTIFIPS